MCEHTGEDSPSNNNTNNNHQEENNSIASSSASSVVSSTSPSNNTNKKQTTPTKRYTHNPYAFSAPFMSSKNVQQQQVEKKKQETAFPNLSPAEVELQRGLDSMLITPDAAQNFHDNNNTLHRSLIGNVSFAPYPTEAVEFNYEYYEAGSPSQFSRVFIGQLPYRVTEMQLQWIFFVFGHGTRIHDPERITKKAKTIGNARVPTGCIHCHIREDKVKSVLECMHKRLLIDDSGIWYARSDKEQDLLEAYINTLKKHPELRFPDRPYDTMVVQEAVSSYQSSQPRWVSNAPEAEKFAETTPSRKAQILYLQQQKMMKQQQQLRSSYPVPPSPAAASASASTTSLALSINTNASYNSSTSSHPNSEGNNNNDYHYHHQQHNHSNHNNNININATAHIPVVAAAAAPYYYQQPQQPLMNKNYNNSNNNSSPYFYNNNTYHR